MLFALDIHQQITIFIDTIMDSVLIHASPVQEIVGNALWNAVVSQRVAIQTLLVDKMQTV